MAEPIVGVLDLTQAAWNRFKSRWAGSVLLSLIMSVLATLVAAAMTATFIAGAATNNQTLPLLGLLAVVLGFAVLVYSSGALLAYLATDQPISLGDALRRASARWWPLVVTSLASLAIVLGASIFLIVPGIIVAIYFSQSQPVTLLEEKQGLAALVRSRTLTNGRWWAILGRYLFLALLLTVITMALTAILRLLNLKVEAAQQWANGLTNLVAGPLVMAYIVELYHSLKEKVVEKPVGTGVYRFLSVLGTLILLAWAAGLVFMTSQVLEFTEGLRQATESGQSTFTVNGIELNVADFDFDPNTLTDDATGTTPDTADEGEVPSDPATLPAQ